MLIQKEYFVKMSGFDDNPFGEPTIDNPFAVSWNCHDDGVNFTNNIKYLNNDAFYCLVVLGSFGTTGSKKHQCTD